MPSGSKLALLCSRILTIDQFLSHDGITTFEELVDAQQNLYNVGYDLAVLLATLGVGLDGDPITGKLSIGCDATERTSATGSLFGEELGLNGHNVSSPLPLSTNLHFVLTIARKEIRRRHIAHPQRLLPRQR